MPITGQVRNTCRVRTAGDPLRGIDGLDQTSLYRAALC
jgi:hypothetical protein